MPIASSGIDNDATRKTAENTGKINNILGKPEWKTWIFWLVIMDIIFQVIGIFLQIQ